MTVSQRQGTVRHVRGIRTRRDGRRRRVNHNRRLIAFSVLMLLYAPIPSTPQETSINKTPTVTKIDPSVNSTIQDLNHKRDLLQNSVDRWNTAYIVGLVLTVIIVV